MTIKVLLFTCISYGILAIKDPVIKKPPRQKKLALVIGISHYTNLDTLGMALSDARDVSKTLTGIGWEVSKLEDPNRKELIDAIEKLAEEVDDSSTCLLYFSGHGICYNGENYILPLDANPKSARHLIKQACSINGMLTRINQQKKLLGSIVLLDACITPIPYARNMTALNKRDVCISCPVDETFISYAADQSSHAMASIKSNNSIFTETLLRYIKRADLSLQQVSRLVAKDVVKRTGGRQLPCTFSNMDKDFFLNTYDIDNVSCATDPTEEVAAPAAPHL